VQSVPSAELVIVEIATAAVTVIAEILVVITASHTVVVAQSSQMVNS
jgi:hypothetical protein